jgi:hypothetical protein
MKRQTKKKMFGGKLPDKYRQETRIIGQTSGITLCDPVNLSVTNLVPLTHITEGLGGGLLYQGIINNIPVVIKIMIPSPNGTNLEICFTRYISDYFLYRRLNVTENFVACYHSSKCMGFFTYNTTPTKELKSDTPSLTRQISTIMSQRQLVPSDIHLLFVEKVSTDFSHYLGEAIQLSPTAEQYELMIFSVIAQTVYTLLVFNQEFDEFLHHDLHCGNVLIEKEPSTIKTFIIQYANGVVKRYNMDNHSICPKIWDFGSSHISQVEHLILDNNEDFNDKYLSYASDRRFICLRRTEAHNIKFDCRTLLLDIYNRLQKSHQIFVQKFGNTFENMLPNLYYILTHRHQIFDNEDILDILMTTACGGTDITINSQNVQILHTLPLWRSDTSRDNIFKYRFQKKSIWLK